MATRKKSTAKGSKATKTTAKKATRTTTAKKTTKKAAATKAKPKTAKTAAKSATRKTTAKKVVAKKAPAKKTAAKKTTAKRATTAKRTPAKAASSLPATAISAKQTKAQIYSDIADMTEVNKAEVKKVFAALKNIVERHVKPKGSGEVTIPELGIKVRRVVKKATKARMGRNPFTGEEIKIAAKPARKSVKATALKALKELA